MMIYNNKCNRAEHTTFARFQIYCTKNTHTANTIKANEIDVWKSESYINSIWTIERNNEEKCHMNIRICCCQQSIELLTGTKMNFVHAVEFFISYQLIALTTYHIIISHPNRDEIMSFNWFKWSIWLLDFLAFEWWGANGNVSISIHSHFLQFCFYLNEFIGWKFCNAFIIFHMNV